MDRVLSKYQPVLGFLLRHLRSAVNLFLASLCYTSQVIISIFCYRSAILIALVGDQRCMAQDLANCTNRYQMSLSPDYICRTFPLILLPSTLFRIPLCSLPLSLFSSLLSLSLSLSLSSLSLPPPLSLF